MATGGKDQESTEGHDDQAYEPVHQTLSGAPQPWIPSHLLQSHVPYGNPAYGADGSRGDFGAPTTPVHPSVLDPAPHLVRPPMPSVFNQYASGSPVPAPISYPDGSAHHLPSVIAQSAGMDVPSMGPPSLPHQHSEGSYEVPVWQTRMPPHEGHQTPASAIPPVFSQQYGGGHSVDTRPRSVSWSTPSDFLNAGRRRSGRMSISAAAPPEPAEPESVNDPNSAMWDYRSGSLPYSTWPSDTSATGASSAQLSPEMQQGSAMINVDASDPRGEGFNLDFDLSDHWTSASTSSTAAGPSRPRSSGRGIAQDTICPYPGCGKLFPKNRLYNLKAHLRSHSNFKPFTCPSCDRSFSRKHDLHRHARVHTGDKPYICDACGKMFPRSDALRRHLKSEPSCKEQADTTGGSTGDGSQGDADGDSGGPASFGSSAFGAEQFADAASGD